MTSLPDAMEVEKTSAGSSQSQEACKTEIGATSALGARAQFVSALVRIARPHHYGKNVLVAVGVLLSLLYGTVSVAEGLPLAFALGFASTCLIASSNYVLNEIFDAASDRFHESKRNRPMVRQCISRPIAFLEWFALLSIGLLIASALGSSFLTAAAGFHLLAIAYNIPPFRLKEFPYIDVLTEAANSPVRLTLGWLIVNPRGLPPLSMLLAFWMAGAFEMARKRLREYRNFQDKSVACAYRKSFSFYDEHRLKMSMVFYAIATAIFGLFEIVECWRLSH